MEVYHFPWRRVLFSEHTVAATHVSALSETLYIYFLTVRLRKKQKTFSCFSYWGLFSIRDVDWNTLILHNNVITIHKLCLQLIGRFKIVFMSHAFLFHENIKTTNAILFSGKKYYRSQGGQWYCYIEWQYSVHCTAWIINNLLFRYDTSGMSWVDVSSMRKNLLLFSI